MTDPRAFQNEAAQAARKRAEALEAALQSAEAAAPPRLPAPIAALMADGSDAEALRSIEAEQLAEEALDWVRSHRRADAALRAKLEPLAAKAKARRAGRVHLEGGRTLARIRYAKEEAALIFGSGELQTLFGEALRLEGLPLELDLGKRPRPLLVCAPPLPPAVGGEAEWLEAQLRHSAEAPDLLARLNRRLPPGLRLIAWEEWPVWATPAAELCVAAHWAWPSDGPGAPEAVAAFLASDAFFLEKVGKIEGQKQEKRVDLRPLVLDMAWEGGELRFTTSLAAAPALNPLKLLAALLGRAPESIAGLRRTGFDMAEDARLKKGDRYTAKLKNMYEDAVLLGAGSNITLVDEDDEEPLSLG
ncbi:MAG TPA: TIGR03936 family radical SAM-associated protein [Holophagaceae bacterium]|nr:TIGR03936 family radical SAM-associated protein [Holophagaceae bacterium]